MCKTDVPGGVSFEVRCRLCVRLSVAYPSAYFLYRGRTVSSSGGFDAVFGGVRRFCRPTFSGLWGRWIGFFGQFRFLQKAELHLFTFEFDD